MSCMARQLQTVTQPVGYEVWLGLVLKPFKLKRDRAVLPRQALWRGTVLLPRRPQWRGSLRNGVHHGYLYIYEVATLHSSLTSNPQRQPQLLPHLHFYNHLRVLVAKTTPKSEMARGFMDVRRAMKAMEGAYPNDPNRSILSLNKSPKGEIPPRVPLWHECGMQGLP
jgi:hypothetical protein